ncbi:MAG: class II D-tagatose-bisphosphate aldolase, non-catalytic subunit [Verrucomicrobiota bacterium]
MIEERLKAFVGDRQRTLLAVGPMSHTCVNASIALANKYGAPLMIIASRRQIDSAEFGGGYVNQWTTPEFAKYVKSRPGGDGIILARDHGGPWQSPLEVEQRLGLGAAMESAKRSYLADIEAGFQMLHIDPSVEIHGELTLIQTLDRVFELYEYCWETAERLGQEVRFEIGTEEQKDSVGTVEELEFVLGAIERFCAKNRIPKPTFVVVQTGTRVLEMRNVGDLPELLAEEGDVPDLRLLAQFSATCKAHGVFLKQHNTDYLSDEVLRAHPKLGIDSVNVAPEFGVAESRAIFGLCREYGLKRWEDIFIDLALASNKWEKWMAPHTQASELDRALIAGHYVFSHPEFIEAKNEAAYCLDNKGVNLAEVLEKAVTGSIERYMRAFGY